MISHNADGCSAEGGYCITCSDEALEAELLRIDEGGTALVAVGAQTLEIDVSLLDGLAVGDRLLIHGGVALAKL